MASAVVTACLLVGIIKRIADIIVKSEDGSLNIMIANALLIQRNDFKPFSPVGALKVIAIRFQIVTSDFKHIRNKPGTWFRFDPENVAAVPNTFLCWVAPHALRKPARFLGRRIVASVLETAPEESKCVCLDM